MTAASASMDHARSTATIPARIAPEPPDPAGAERDTPTNAGPTDGMPAPPPRGPGPPPSTGGWPAIAECARELGPEPACEHLSDEQVEVELRRSAGAVASATARFLVQVAEHVVRGRWAEAGMTTPGQWLSWAVGMAPSTGREMVRVALALRTFTRVRDRFLAGTISYSKVRAITRVGEPALEDTLLTFADNAPASQLERVVRTFRGLDARESAHDRRGVTIRHLESGDVELRVRLPRETGLRAASQLERDRAASGIACPRRDLPSPRLCGHPPPPRPSRRPLGRRRANRPCQPRAVVWCPSPSRPSPRPARRARSRHRTHDRHETRRRWSDPPRADSDRDRTCRFRESGRTPRHSRPRTSQLVGRRARPRCCRRPPPAPDRPNPRSRHRRLTFVPPPDGSPAS